MGEASALPIPEFRSEDSQDNILAAVEDALTTLLEEELAAETAAKTTMTHSAKAREQAESPDVDGKPANAPPTPSET